MRATPLILLKSIHFGGKGRVPHDEATPSSFFNNFPLALTFHLIFRWGVIEHPTFGRVPRVVTIKDLKAGQELSCHYMIDMEEAADESIRYHPYITYHFKGDRGGFGK